jgi:hypothetical protein
MLSEISQTQKGMAQVVEYLPSKHEALSSDPDTTKKYTNT